MAVSLKSILIHPPFQILARISRNLETFTKPWACCHSSALCGLVRSLGGHHVS